MKIFRQALCFAILLGILASPVIALTNQVVLFTGFSSDAGPDTGMGILNSTLARVGIPDYLGRVFEWNQRQQAFDWVQQQTGNRSTLVIIGHSYGGNSALQLAGNLFKPAGVNVDLTIQIDSFPNFDPGANDKLPTNVDVGINYYQPDGVLGWRILPTEDNVQGATNINVEELFNDTSITHTTIDDDPRLHSLIAQNIFDNLNSASGDFDQDGDIDGADFLVWQRNPSVGSLSEWQANYGSVPHSAASAVVPEPSTFVLLVMTAHLQLLSRRHTCLRGI